MEIYILLGFVLILSIYLGLELISKVPSMLGTLDISSRPR